MMTNAQALSAIAAARSNIANVSADIDAVATYVSDFQSTQDNVTTEVESALTGLAQEAAALKVKGDTAALLLPHS